MDATIYSSEIMSVDFAIETPLPAAGGGISPDDGTNTARDVINECHYHEAGDKLQNSTHAPKTKSEATDDAIVAGPITESPITEDMPLGGPRITSIRTTTRGKNQPRDSSSMGMPGDDGFYSKTSLRMLATKAAQYIDKLQSEGVPELSVSGIEFGDDSFMGVQHPDDANVMLRAERMSSWMDTNVLSNYYDYHVKILKLEHKHISRIVGFARTTGGEPVLLFPYTNDLTLWKHAMTMSVPIYECLKYMRQILSALEYMHNGHDGVKVAKGAFFENSIRINSQNEAYFSNHWSNFFEMKGSGTWKVTNPPECDADKCGPDEWFGVRGLANSLDVQCRGDMWYFGLILLRMANYHNWVQVVLDIKAGERPDRPDGVDNRMWELIVDNCLITEPSKRITAEGAMPMLEMLVKRGEYVAKLNSLQDSVQELERLVKRSKVEGRMSLFETLDSVVRGWIFEWVLPSLSSLGKMFWKFTPVWSIRKWFIA